MNTQAFPYGVSRLDADSPRYARIRSWLAPDEELYCICEVRTGMDLNLGWYWLSIGLTLPIRILLEEGTRDSVYYDVQTFVPIIIIVFTGAVAILMYMRNATWYGFSRSSLYVRVVYRAGFLCDQFTVDRDSVQEIVFSSTRPEPGGVSRVDAKLMDGKTVVLCDPNGKFARTKWLADQFSLWLGREPDAAPGVERIFSDLY